MAVAAEWDAQVTEKGLEPALMPLMALASTAIDQVHGGLWFIGYTAIDRVLRHRQGTIPSIRYTDIDRLYLHR